MKRLGVAMALCGLSLTVAGCDWIPGVSYIREALSSGYPPLETNQYVTEIAPNLPDNIQTYLNAGLAVSPDGARYAYSWAKDNFSGARLYIGKVGEPARETSVTTMGYFWWSPDSKRIAFAEAIPSPSPRPHSVVALKVLVPDTGEVSMIREKVEAGFGPWLSWSPKGDAILYAERQNPEDNTQITMALMELAIGSQEPKQIAILAEAGPETNSAYWTPDAERVVFRSKAAGFIESVNLTMYDRSDQSTRVIRRVPRWAPLTMASDGEAIAYMSGDYTNSSGNWESRKIRLSDGSEEVTPFSLGEATVTKTGNMTVVASYYARDISPNLRWCLISKGESPLYARELATGKQFQLTSGPATPKGWMPDSKAVVMQTMKGARAHYYLVKVER